MFEKISLVFPILQNYEKTSFAVKTKALYWKKWKLQRNTKNSTSTVEKNSTDDAVKNLLEWNKIISFRISQLWYIITFQISQQLPWFDCVV